MMLPCVKLWFQSIWALMHFLNILKFLVSFDSFHLLCECEILVFSLFFYLFCAVCIYIPIHTHAQKNDNENAIASHHQQTTDRNNEQHNLFWMSTFIHHFSAMSELSRKLIFLSTWIVIFLSFRLMYATCSIPLFSTCPFSTNIAYVYRALLSPLKSLPLFRLKWIIFFAGPCLELYTTVQCLMAMHHWVRFYFACNDRRHKLHPNKT